MATSFTFRVNDGFTNSPNATVSITVAPVNDAPSFVKGADVTVAEDSSAFTQAGWATSISKGPANESAQTVSFVITGNTNAGLFSAGPAVSPTGALTFTPAANAFGSATITLKITDSGGTANGGVDESATQTFNITVTPVNDAPVCQNTSLTTAEDTVGSTAPVLHRRRWRHADLLDRRPAGTNGTAAVVAGDARSTPRTPTSTAPTRSPIGPTTGPSTATPPPST